MIALGLRTVREPLIVAVTAMMLGAGLAGLRSISALLVVLAATLLIAVTVLLRAQALIMGLGAAITLRRPRPRRAFA